MSVSPVKKPLRKPLIVILVRRAVLFFFFLSIIVVYLYCLGTAQEFMDRTQLLLLRFSLGLGLSLGLSSLYGLGMSVWPIIRRRKHRFLGGAILYIAMGLFGAAIAALAAFIMAAAGGNRA
ncbi:hypothetical protein AGMMS49940_13100 [Spirochaetia bacterium]|nr:hypothetical protein AGMMS49940_13100 [Spirochaetia bacterium]